MSKVREGLSIIIPVYNVAKYLEQCLYSVVNQVTSFEFEIILVNDGSTDNSGEICSHWHRNYTNISYYEKENEGLGPTRHYGIDKSKYRYITFLDSDDWLDSCFVEKMMSQIILKNADIVYCDATYYYENTREFNKSYFRSNLQLAGANTSMRLTMGYPNMWGAVYRKDLWQENNIIMPNIYYEDTAIYGVLLAKAKKIDCVEGNYYYYRVGRPGSIMQLGKSDPAYMLCALESLLVSANKADVYMNLEVGLQDFCFRQLVGEWEKILWQKDTEKMVVARLEFQKFLDDHFNGWEKYFGQNAVSIGSYASSAVYNRIKLFREFVGNKCQFSSLISLMSKKYRRDQLILSSEISDFRRECLEKQLFDSIEQVIGTEKIVIIDLLDELNDIIKINDDDIYINDTEAFKEAYQIDCNIYRIDRNSDERYELWKNSCDRFVSWNRENGNKIVLLKIFLCNQYGQENIREKYELIDNINTQNNILQRYYDYVENRFSDVHIVELPDFWRFTDAKFKFGCEPRYYNEFAYFLLAFNVLKKIRIINDLVD